MTQKIVVPLFSSPIAIYKIDEDFLVDTHYQFIDIHSEDVKQTYVSKRKDVLEDYPNLKNKIIECFNDYKDNIFCYTKTEFRITTSWMSKTEPGGCSQYHKHSNSMFSAVHYFDIDEKDAPLQFKTNSVLSNYCLSVSERNIYNTDTQSFAPQKNYIIIFPSHLEHRIGHHRGSKTRYSLACNFYPVGELGGGDSYINIQLD